MTESSPVEEETEKTKSSSAKVGCKGTAGAKYACLLRMERYLLGSSQLFSGGLGDVTARKAQALKAATPRARFLQVKADPPSGACGSEYKGTQGLRPKY